MTTRDPPIFSIRALHFMMDRVAVSLVSDRIGSSTQHGLNGKLQLGDYLNARARIKNNRYKRDYAAKKIAFAPAILSVADSS